MGLFRKIVRTGEAILRAFSLGSGGGVSYSTTPFTTELGDTLFKRNFGRGDILSLPSVSASLSYLAISLATLKFKIIDGYSVGMGKENRSRWEYLLNGEIFGVQTRAEFFRLIVGDLFLEGNAFCKVDFDENADIRLIYLPSSMMKCEILESRMTTGLERKVNYVYKSPHGDRKIPSKDILHFTHGNYEGQVRNGQSTGKKHGSLYQIILENLHAISERLGKEPTGIIHFKHRQDASRADQDAELKDFKASLKKGSGLSVMPGHIEYQDISSTPQEVHYIETFRELEQRIPTIFGISASLLMGDGDAIKDLAPSKTLFAKRGLMPICKEIEGEFNRKVFSRLRYPLGNKIKIIVNSFDETDFAEITAAAIAAVSAGIMTANEARPAFNLEKLDDKECDKLRQNLATTDMQTGKDYLDSKAGRKKKEEEVEEKKEK